jgi:hypothetical protein
MAALQLCEVYIIVLLTVVRGAILCGGVVQVYVMVAW